MIAKKTARYWLPVLAALLALPAYGEELLPLENYELPPLLFDDAPSASSQNAQAGFLTAIEPLREPEKHDKAPLPPKKPKAPAKIVKKAAAAPVTAVAKAPARPFTPEKPPLKSTTQLESGQRLVNPNVRDVLASIEGVNSTQQKGDGKVILVFLPGETILNLDMKNKLLRDFVPALKESRESRVAIQAYASSKDGGETGARRLSLARALEARDFLTAAGVDASRIDVMPLGNQADSSSPDRVDLLISAPKGR